MLPSVHTGVVESPETSYNHQDEETLYDSACCHVPALSTKQCSLCWKASNHPPDSYPQELTKGPQIWATERYDGCCGSVVPATAKGAHIRSFE